MKISLAFSLSMSFVFIFFLIGQEYQLTRDIESYAQRAEISKNAEKMRENMQSLKNGMQQHGLDQKDSLSELNKSIDDVINRLVVVQEIPMTKTIQETQLAALRAEIQELNISSMRFLWIRYWYLFLSFGIWFWPISLSVIREYQEFAYDHKQPNHSPKRK